jgi:hypothetical protein
LLTKLVVNFFLEIRKSPVNQYGWSI